MKRKILLLLALAVLTCLALVSCASKPSKIYNTDYSESAPYEEAIELESLSLFEEAKGSLVCFDTPENTIPKISGVVNARTGEVLCKYTSTSYIGAGEISYDIQLIKPSLADEAVFLVTKTTISSSFALPEKEITLYDANGNALEQYIGTKALGATAINDLVIFNNKAFRIKGDEVEHAFDTSILGSSVPSCDYVTDSYNYAIDEKSVRIYNGEYKLVASFDAPSYATSSWFNIMNDGNVLIQYTTKQSADARSYDILLDGNKYKLESLILKAKNGKTKSVNLNYLVYDVDNAIVNPDYSSEFKKPDNVAEIYEIEDKMVDLTSPRTAWLKKNGKVKKYIDENITAQTGALELVADNRFVATDKQGRSFLLDEEGEILGEITNAVKAKALRDGFIFLNGEIYNYDLELVLDIGKEGYELVNVANSYIILKKTSNNLYFGDDEYYIYSKKTGAEKLDISLSCAIEEITDEFFVVYTGSSYNYYNSVGELLISDNGLYDSAIDCGDMMLLVSQYGTCYSVK